MNTIDRHSKKIKEGFIGQKMIVLPPDVVKKVVKNMLIQRLYLTAIGYYPHASFHDRERKQGSNQYIFLYCTEGKGNIEIAGKNVEMVPNTYFIIPKNTAHHYKSSADAPWSIYWVHFIGEHADALYQRYLEKQQNFIPYDERKINAFNEVFNLLESSFDIHTLEILNIRLFDFISSFIYQKDLDPAVNDNDVASNSIGFMKEHLNSSFAIDDFARQQKLSVSHYSRLFYQKAGSSPVRYFNQLKIQRSCQMLYFTNRSIKEICLELGFTDPYYFSRLFKKLMGISPAKYKSQHKTN